MPGKTTQWESAILISLMACTKSSEEEEEEAAALLAKLGKEEEEDEEAHRRLSFRVILRKKNETRGNIAHRSDKGEL